MSISSTSHTPPPLVVADQPLHPQPKKTFRSHYARHSFWLTSEEEKRMQAILQERQCTLTEWIRSMMPLQESSRFVVPKSKVMRVLPLELAQAAEELFDEKAQEIMRYAERLTLPAELPQRRKKRQEAGRYYDGAGWFRATLLLYSQATYEPEEPEE